MKDINKIYLIKDINKNEIIGSFSNEGSALAFVEEIGTDDYAIQPICNFDGLKQYHKELAVYERLVNYTLLGGYEVLTKPSAIGHSSSIRKDVEIISDSDPCGINKFHRLWRITYTGEMTEEELIATVQKMNI